MTIKRVRPIALTLFIALCAGLFGELAFTPRAGAETMRTLPGFVIVEMVIDGETHEVQVRENAPKLHVHAGAHYD
ncbi:MAG: hypothetical protein ACJASC_003086 [Limimaricola cinnabarinus]|jgi:hypothetical protein|uniref:Uncharacterized protein n=1 Tax=Limimaricola cinnabarinus LL-001 TaxID=1337093 RepID=U2Z4H2_9RHOB|nr:hypothetical protein [Limimaricola cinnabarinus]GAD55962.1 hypothetical protein MBELCI_2014 [Limimaricola cinnabarinus LL-001]